MMFDFYDILTGYLAGIKKGKEKVGQLPSIRCECCKYSSVTLIKKGDVYYCKACILKDADEKHNVEIKEVEKEFEEM